MTKYFTINERGFSVRCKLYCADEKKIDSVIVYSHGFGGNKDNKTAEKLADRVQKRHPGTALVIFNWPCHGDDARNKLLLGDCLEYLDIVIGYVKKRFQTNTLFGTANSFGGYTFLRYIEQRGNPFKRIALRCPAVYMHELLTSAIMTEENRIALQKHKPVSVGFDKKVKITCDFINELKEADITRCDYTPFADDLIILHGTKDEVVSFDRVKAFAEANRIPFYPCESGNHQFTDPDILDQALARISRFFFEPQP